MKTQYLNFKAIFNKIGLSCLVLGFVSLNTTAQNLDSLLKDKVKISTYLDAYYAHYSDMNDGTLYQQFPTANPRNKQIGLNLAQVSAKYTDSSARGILTLQYGDIPKSAWDANFNMLQEANVGFRLYKQIWLDAGFFRTHIGYESIQPRENIASSFAITTYYEPYYLSGAKLNIPLTKEILFQAQVFNSFSTFVSTNQRKSYGWEVYYTHNDRLMFTSNFLVSHNNSAIYTGIKPRIYLDVFGKYSTNKIDIVGEFNFSGQQKSALKDSNATAYMQSSLLALKYKFTNKKAIYTRGAFYNDPDQMLTGKLMDKDGKLTGLSLWEITGGVEYKPSINSYIRLEGRLIKQTSNTAIFQNGKRERSEISISTGLWF